MKILVAEPEEMAPEVKADLHAIGRVVFGPFDNQTLIQELVDCDVLMVRLSRYIGETLMDCAPRLRYIVSATTGLDHIDLDAARRRNIRVVSLRDCSHLVCDVSATAEHTWGLLLALVRYTIPAVKHVIEGGWDRNLFWGTQLQGKRLGIIGFGRIGRMVARYGIAFGMDVVAYDRVPSNVLPPVSAMPLEELLTTSMVVSIHVTGEPANRHFIDRRLVGLMRADSFLINTARGMIVDTAALAEAVLERRIAGVAVDVLDGEEHSVAPHNLLLMCARKGHNVLITPHVGGATRESISRTERAVTALLGNLVSPLKASNFLLEKPQ